MTNILSEHNTFKSSLVWSQVPVVLWDISILVSQLLVFHCTQASEWERLRIIPLHKLSAGWRTTHNIENLRLAGFFRPDKANDSLICTYWNHNRKILIKHFVTSFVSHFSIDTLHVVGAQKVKKGNKIIQKMFITPHCMASDIWFVPKRNLSGDRGYYRQHRLISLIHSSPLTIYEIYYTVTTL